jgi:phosphoglycerate dehydrogenase-like enzyme
VPSPSPDTPSSDAPDARAPAPNAPADVVVLCQHADSIPRIRARFPTLEIVDIAGGIPDGIRGDVLFGGFGAPAAAAVTGGVRWVQMIGTGVDGISDEVRAVPILTSSRGASAGPISEYVVATMCAFARNFPANWLTSAPDHWNFQTAAPLAGKTVGLFGFGGIAQRVARVALALEMKVVALRRQPAPSPVEGVEMVRSLPDLMAASDHLVVAAPATDATRHAINAETLQHLRPGAHLVNIARGSLIDQEALRVALDDGTVARASLDVTDPEPLPAGHWLYTHEQVFLTPHASWVGPAPFEASTQLFCDNLQRFLDGEPLHGVVGPDGY